MKFHSHMQSEHGIGSFGAVLDKVLRSVHQSGGRFHFGFLFSFVPQCLFSANFFLDFFFKVNFYFGEINYTVAN